MGKCGAVCLQYLRLMCMWGLHTIFVALLLTRSLRNNGWSWFVVFTPLFIFDGVAFLYCLAYLITYIVERVSDEDDYRRNCFPGQTVSLKVLPFYVVGLSLKLAAEVLTCLSLQNSVPFYVPGILFSLLFLEAGCVLMFYSLKPAIRLAQRFC